MANPEDDRWLFGDPGLRDMVRRARSDANYIDELLAENLFYAVEFFKQGHAALVLVATSNLSNRLERILRAHMPNLSARVAEKLFEGYGPLSTFSARIDLTYAFGLISKEAHDELNFLRAVRNLFAHADEITHLESERVISLFKQCHRWREGADAFALLRERLDMCRKGLEVAESEIEKCSTNPSSRA